MEYDKARAKSGSMTTGTGLCSHKTNPLKAATRTSRECGPGLGHGPTAGDQAHANKLLQKAHMQKDSQRGMAGY